MKKDIDLSDPKIKLFLQMTATQAEKATSVKQRVESAVIPIFNFNKSRHQWEQNGSAVALEVDGIHFLLTAAHVFNPDDKNRLWIGIGPSIIPLIGSSIISAREKSGTHLEDPLDAGILHIQNEIPDELREISLTLNDIDHQDIDDNGCVYIVSGYRASVSKIRAGRAEGKREIFVSREISEHQYDSLGMDRSKNLCIAYHDQNSVNGKWQTSPTPKGFSGGAVVKIHGIPAIRYSTSTEDLSSAKQLLTGITVAQRREKSGNPGVLISTRVKIHLEIIKLILPRLL